MFITYIEKGVSEAEDTKAITLDKITLVYVSHIVIGSNYMAKILY